MRTRAILPFLAPLVLVTACGGGDEQVVIEATPAAVAAAGQSTLDAESARVEFTMTVDLGGFGLPVDAPLEIAGEGLIDFTGRRTSLELDLSSMLAAFGDDVPAGVGSMFDDPVRSIQDGTVSYQCAGFYELLLGSECIRMDLEELTGRDLERMPANGLSADPASLLRSLGGTDEVEEVGQEEVFGVTTTHLRGTFTLSDAIAALPGDAAEELQAAYERMGLDESGLDTGQQFDVWVDEAGRVRQIRQTIDLGGLAGGGDPATFEMRYVEFDVDVDIEVPTDAVDLSELTGLLGGG
jgi:hypothetical protein